MTYNESGNSIVHTGHLYECHFSVLREELEGLHGEAILGEGIPDFLLGHSSAGTTMKMNYHEILIWIKFKLNYSGDRSESTRQKHIRKR